jgi:hypothetical protein
MEVSVMKGVQKAFQRARRRSSLSSSKLFFGKGLSTLFRKAMIPFSGLIDDSSAALSISADII